MNAIRCGWRSIARCVRVLLVAALACLVMSDREILAQGVSAPNSAVQFPSRPVEGAFIADAAGMLTPSDAQAIKATCAGLLANQKVPIIVCTISSLADYGAKGGTSAWSIERYAINLFDEWGIGSAATNRGVLLLVSKGDRKARIELGRGFDREFSGRTDRVMSQVIVPAMKRGDASGAIRAGVEQLAVELGGTVPASHASIASPANAPAAGAGTRAAPNRPNDSPAQAPATSAAPAASRVSAMSCMLISGALVLGGGAVIAVIVLVIRALIRRSSEATGGPVAGMVGDTTRMEQYSRVNNGGVGGAAGGVAAGWLAGHLAAGSSRTSMDHSSTTDSSSPDPGSHTAFDSGSSSGSGSSGSW